MNTPLQRDRIYRPCPFTAWMKNCPGFQHLRFFFIFPSSNVLVWLGVSPTHHIPRLSSLVQGTCERKAVHSGLTFGAALAWTFAGVFLEFGATSQTVLWVFFFVLLSFQTTAGDLILVLRLILCTLHNTWPDFFRDYWALVGQGKWDGDKERNNLESSLH